MFIIVGMIWVNVKGQGKVLPQNTRKHQPNVVSYRLYILGGEASQMSKRFLLILATIVVVFGGLLIFNKKETKAPSNNGGDNGPAQLSQHKLKGSSGVVLIEYGDFQCPSCGQYHPLLKELKKKYAGKVTFQFRHYPLTEIHQNALFAARAAEAAAMQGRFWEMHDMLFQNQSEWSDSTNATPIFEGYAKKFDLNMDQFRADIKSENVNNIIQADRAEARRLGYQSTPTFELDGKKIDNPTSIEEFSKLLDEAIKQKQNNKQQN